MKTRGVPKYFWHPFQKIAGRYCKTVFRRVRGTGWESSAKAKCPRMIPAAWEGTFPQSWDQGAAVSTSRQSLFSLWFRWPRHSCLLCSALTTGRRNLCAFKVSASHPGKYVYFIQVLDTYFKEKYGLLPFTSTSIHTSDIYQYRKRGCIQKCSIYKLVNS